MTNVQLDMPFRSRSAFTPILIGLTTIAVSIGGLCAWSSLVTIASAVIVPGVVVVDSGRKVIQQQDGGTVNSISVREGEHVEEGQLLLTLDGSQLYPVADTLQRLLAMNLVERARLEAEQAHQTKVDFPEPDASVAPATFKRIVEREKQLFVSRLASLNLKIDTFRNERMGFLQTAANLEAQIALVRNRILLSQRELADAQTLERTHDESRERVIELIRSIDELGGEAEMLASQEEDARAKAQHSELEADRTRAAFIESVNTDLEQSEKNRLDLSEKLLTVRQQISRLRVVSPVAGEIVNQSVHTIGAVVAAGASLLEVVPSGDPLEVEGEVRPEDVDEIHVGVPVNVALTGFVGQRLPRLKGIVAAVSADRIEDPARQSGFFRVRVSIPASERFSLQHHDLRPGMAVTMMLCTGYETPLRYLSSPLLTFFSDSMH